jgi:hypothetical protein
MSISQFKKWGYELPEKDSGEGLTAFDILRCLDDYLTACDKAQGESNMDGMFDGYFIELLTNYPNSMCKRQLGEKLQYLIALFYAEGTPSQEEIATYEMEKSKHDKEPWQYPLTLLAPEQVWTYDNLALIFNVSKASIFAAIHKYQDEAAKAVDDIRLHTTAKDLALKELVELEKLKLMKNNTNNQTNERTASIPPEEDNTPQKT